MNDRVLVEALRARDPGALAALYDTHAESIYRYCWSLLMSADSAQVALRDTLITAEAHVGSLADPDRLSAWLYALARGECMRRRLSVPPGADAALGEAPPLDDPADADLRVMAWNATQSLSAHDREILELSTRHDLSTLDVAAVLGVAPRQIETAQEDARERLRDAITAEVLARKGPYDCPRRARILTGFSGELTQEMRDQLVHHLARCEICAPHRVREVSTAKVFELMPVVTLPETLRVRVMSCFIDPELLPYRRYVARRSAALDAAGFPAAGDRRRRRWPQALAGALAAVATVIAIAAIFHHFGTDRGLSGIASGAFPATGEPPGVKLPWRSDPQDTPVQVEPILDSTATHPIDPLRSGAPVAATVPDSGPIRQQTSWPTHTTSTVAPAPSPTATPTATTPAREPAVEPQEQPVDHQGNREGTGHHGNHTKTPCPTPTPTAKPTQTAPATPSQTPTQVPTQAPTQAPTPAEPTPTPTG